MDYVKGKTMDFDCVHRMYEYSTKKFKPNNLARTLICANHDHPSPSPIYCRTACTQIHQPPKAEIYPDAEFMNVHYHLCFWA